MCRDAGAEKGIQPVNTERLTGYHQLFWSVCAHSIVSRSGLGMVAQNAVADAGVSSCRSWSGWSTEAQLTAHWRHTLHNVYQNPHVPDWVRHRLPEFGMS